MWENLAKPIFFYPWKILHLDAKNEMKLIWRLSQYMQYSKRLKKYFIMLYLLVCLIISAGSICWLKLYKRNLWENSFLFKEWISDFAFGRRAILHPSEEFSTGKKNWFCQILPHHFEPLFWRVKKPTFFRFHFKFFKENTKLRTKNPLPWGSRMKKEYFILWSWDLEDAKVRYHREQQSKSRCFFKEVDG